MQTSAQDTQIACANTKCTQERQDKHIELYKQELMSAAKRREGASNCRTLFVPSSVESRALNLAENAPCKVSGMFAPTSLRSQQVAIITAGGLLGIHTSHSSNLKAR